MNLTTESGSILRVVKIIVFHGRDVGNCSDNSSVMADKAKNKKRGNYCVAGGTNMATKNNLLTPGVLMHHFMKDETLRKKWTRFVRVHRKDSVSSKSATFFSVHFGEKCFKSKPVSFSSADTDMAIHPKRYLIVGSVPTRYTVVPHSSPLTSWKR